MFNSQKIDIKKIKKIAEELIKKIDSEAKITALEAVDKTVVISVKTDDSELLIGKNGETLQAIHHLLRVMAHKISGTPCFIDLDINDFRKKRRDYLKELAVLTANDAALSKKEIVLAPMNSYERRIVHMELAERRDVATESRGSEADRRIAIKPAE